MDYTKHFASYKACHLLICLFHTSSHLQIFNLFDCPKIKASIILHYLLWCHMDRVTLFTLFYSFTEVALFAPLSTKAWHSVQSTPLLIPISLKVCTLLSPFCCPLLRSCQQQVIKLHTHSVIKGIKTKSSLKQSKEWHNILFSKHGAMAVHSRALVFRSALDWEVAYVRAEPNYKRGWWPKKLKCIIRDRQKPNNISGNAHGNK